MLADSSQGGEKRAMTQPNDAVGNRQTGSSGAAWAAWFLGSLFYCYGYFHRVAPSVLTDDLMREFSASGAILGNLTAFYFYAYAGCQIPIGLMIDRFGPRRMLTAAALLCGAGSLLFGLAQGTGMAYLGRAFVGAGAGVAWLGTLQTAGLLFPARRFALLSGMTLMMGMIGAIGAQAPLAVLVEAVGWRASLVASGVASAALAALIWLTVRGAAARGAQHHVSGGLASLLSGLRQAAVRPQTWFCGIYGAGLGGPLLAFAGLWGVPYMMQAYGLDRPGAAFCTTLLLIGWAIGAPLSGWLSDRMGSRRVPMLVASSGGFATFALALYLPGLPLIAVQALLLVHGIFAGAMILAFVTAREHNDRSVAATVMALVNITVMGCAAGFQPLIGWLLDLGWDGRLVDGARVYSAGGFEIALLTLVIGCAAAVLAAVLLRETHCRQVDIRPEG